MRKLPKRNTQNARVTDPRAKMKVLGKDRERKQKLLQQMIQILRVKRKVQRRKRKRRKNPPVKNQRVRKKDPERNTRRKRNIRSIRRTRNIRSTRRGKMIVVARMPVMMKKKKSLKENYEKRH